MDSYGMEERCQGWPDQANILIFMLKVSILAKNVIALARAGKYNRLTGSQAHRLTGSQAHRPKFRFNRSLASPVSGTPMACAAAARPSTFACRKVATPRRPPSSSRSGQVRSTRLPADYCSAAASDRAFLLSPHRPVVSVSNSRCLWAAADRLMHAKKSGIKS